MRILIVGVNWLGDVLFLTPSLRALRKKFPQAVITCAVPLRAIPLLRNNPHLNEVMEWDDKIFLWTPFKFLRLFWRLRKRNFDAAIFFHRSKTKVWIAKLAGIPERVGYEARFRNGLLTRAFPMPAGRLHRLDIFLELIRQWGVPPDGRRLDFNARREAEAELSALLLKKGISSSDVYVVVHAGGNWELKRWPAGHFVRWIGLFLEKYPMKVVLCGTNPERALSEEIASHFTDGRVVSLCGQTSLDLLALLLKNSRLLVSNDSGPIHLAASQNVRILGLFGPTSVEETGPVSEAPLRILRKDVGCEIPCYFRSCRGRVCMEWLAPEEALAEAEELLS